MSELARSTRQKPEGGASGYRTSMVRFILNGTPVCSGEGALREPHGSLLAWLRAAGLTGTKEGCAEGECGACAVAMVRTDERGVVRYESVNSCLVPLASVHGRSVLTVEGVALPDGTLHPVQRALVERGGSQCGYCTPGFVISLFCEYYRPERTHYDPEAISGNLCRCTGYRPIADVARALPQPRADDPRLPLLAERAPDAQALQVSAREHRPNAAAPVEGDGDVRFLQPSALPQLFAQWAERPEAVLIAGGTDLMVEANQRHRRWSTLISLDALAELSRFERTADELVIGAGVRLADIERRLVHEGLGELPLLEQLMPLFSSRLIRNRATLGGSLATASPIGDAAPVLLALDAELLLRRGDGARRIALRDFFRGYRATLLARQELIESIHIPLPAPPLQRFYKVSKRVLDDISTVAAAFALELDDAQRVKRLRIAYGGIAATPICASAAEALALGRPWSADTVAALLPALAQLGTPQTDQRGQAGYRRALVGKLLEKFFFETQPAHLQTTPQEVSP